MFLSQTQYALEILERASMSSCRPTSTSVDTSPKLGAVAGPPIDDPSAYRSLAGALQYLTFTRPDIAYDVQQICLHMHDPRDQHLSLVKHACSSLHERYVAPWSLACTVRYESPSRVYWCGLD
jgi:hypothetical protein